MPGFALLAIGFGMLIGAVVTYALGDDAHKAAQSAAGVGAALPPLRRGMALARKPAAAQQRQRNVAPIARVGEPIYVLPMKRWGKCEGVTRTKQGWNYGVRFKNGRIAVFGQHQVVK